RLATTRLKRMSSLVFSLSAPAVCTDRMSAPKAFCDSVAVPVAVSNASAQQTSWRGVESEVDGFMDLIIGFGVPPSGGRVNAELRTIASGALRLTRIILSDEPAI